MTAEPLSPAAAAFLLVDHQAGVLERVVRVPAAAEVEADVLRLSVAGTARRQLIAAGIGTEVGRGWCRSTARGAPETRARRSIIGSTGSLGQRPPGMGSAAALTTREGRLSPALPLLPMGFDYGVGPVYRKMNSPKSRSLPRTIRSPFWSSARATPQKLLPCGSM
jgi:hypothetical protein